MVVVDALLDVMIGGSLFVRAVDIRVGVGMLWLGHTSFWVYDSDGGSHGSDHREFVDSGSDGGSHGAAQSELVDDDSDGGSHGSDQSSVRSWLLLSGDGGTGVSCFGIVGGRDVACFSGSGFLQRGVVAPSAVHT